jgi:hypothetical protein
MISVFATLAFFLLRGIPRGLRGDSGEHRLFSFISWENRILLPAFCYLQLLSWCLFAAEGVLLLHANLTIHDIDPTTGDPEDVESDPGERPSLSF